MRYSRLVNVSRMHVILNGEPFEEVDCFKYLESQMAADGGGERDMIHRIKEWYQSSGTMKNVLRNRGLGINAKKCL